MITRRRFIGLLGGGTAVAGTAALGAAALPGAEEASAYPSIAYGQESCADCGMGIDDARYAAAWRSAEGERHFDDIGCMVSAYHQDHPAGDVRYFVHDYHSQAWLDATAATYVVSPAIKTPMAYGVFASADGAGAASHSGHTGMAHYDWTGLLENLERKS